MCLEINLLYTLKNEKFRIQATNVKKEKIDEILAECYRSSLNQKPDYSHPKNKKEYVIKIKLDLETDVFKIKQNTGNEVLAYELIRESIGNWEFTN